LYKTKACSIVGAGFFYLLKQKKLPILWAALFVVNNDVRYKHYCLDIA